MKRYEKEQVPLPPGAAPPPVGTPRRGTPVCWRASTAWTLQRQVGQAQRDRTAPDDRTAPPGQYGGRNVTAAAAAAAVGHQAPQGVHRVVRDLLQPGEAGAVEAEDHRQDGGGGAHGEGGAGPLHQVPLPRLRQAAAAGARHQRRLLQLRRQEGELPLHQARAVGRSRLPHRPHRAQRGQPLPPPRARSHGSRSAAGRRAPPLRLFKARRWPKK